MPVVARSATTLTHTTAVVIPAAASWGTAANVPDGDSFPNGGNTILVMNNTGAVDGRVHSLAAGEIKVVKLGPPAIYGNPTKATAENAAVLLIAYAL